MCIGITGEAIFNPNLLAKMSVDFQGIISKPKLLHINLPGLLHYLCRNMQTWMKQALCDRDSLTHIQ